MFEWREESRVTAAKSKRTYRMSQIKVNCPECHKSVTLETEMLQQNDGKAVCSHCFHIFKLVKKTPKTAAGKKQPATAATKGKNGKAAKESKTAESKLAKTVKAMSSQTRTQQQQPLHYREPKARSAKPMFAEVPQNPSPTVFNLLDRDSASAQLPQISLQPGLGTASHRKTTSPSTPTAWSSRWWATITPAQPHLPPYRTARCPAQSPPAARLPPPPCRWPYRRNTKSTGLSPRSPPWPC